MFLIKGRKTKKEALLEKLAKEDLQVLLLAYAYAKNLYMYGEDVTKAIYSATENVEILGKAYRKGYYDAMNKTIAKNEDKKMTTDEIIEALTKMNELILLEEAKQEKRIEDAVLIMHPKHKDLIAASGLKAFIVWSYLCDEDKAYMVTDENWADEIKRNYILGNNNGDEI